MGTARDVSEQMGRIRGALTAARGSSQVRDAMLEEGFLGISGEGGVGKSTLVRRAEAMLTLEGRASVVHLNLGGAYSLAKLVARWRHALLRAVAGPIAVSHASALPRESWPASTEGAMLSARSHLGRDFEAALRASPRKGERPESIRAPLDMTVALAEGGRPCVLVIDHLDAPLLSSRHPIVPRDLLWQVREAAQRTRSLRVVVVCAAGSELIAARDDAAFYGDGRWMTIRAPEPDHWASAGAAAGVPVSRDLLRLGRDHVEATLQLLRASLEHGLGARETFASLAGTQGEHASRCLAHANSLHRLGAHVLRSIANGEGPYEGTPDARSDDVASAVGQLRIAGLIRRDRRDSRSWEVADPLVRWRLADPMNLHDDDPWPGLKNVSVAAVDLLNAIQTLQLRKEPTTVDEMAIELTSDEADVRATVRAALGSGLIRSDQEDSRLILTPEGEDRLLEYLESH